MEMNMKKIKYKFLIKFLDIKKKIKANFRSVSDSIFVDLPNIMPDSVERYEWEEFLRFLITKKVINNYEWNPIQVIELEQEEDGVRIYTRFLIKKMNWFLLIKLVGLCWDAKALDKTEIFSSDKQDKILSDCILKKSKRLDSSNIVVDENDLDDAKCSISLFASALRLEKNGTIEIYDVNYNLNNICKDTSDERVFLNIGVRERELGEIKFNSKKGILSCGFREIAMPFDSKEFAICKIVINSNNGKDVEMILDTLDPELYYKKDWRMIYDTVKRINEKCKREFNLDDVLIYKNKHVGVNSLYN